MLTGLVLGIALFLSPLLVGFALFVLIFMIMRKRN
jgi:hypothetical protein